MRKMQKMHVKIGDSVKIISGSDKNKIGEVIKLYRSTGKILVKGINFKYICLLSLLASLVKIPMTFKFLTTDKISKSLKKKFLFKFLLLFIFFPLSVFSQVHETKLSNGMRILVKEDNRSPVVVSQVWYRAGSIDEVNGKTGIAHALEHMMFKGTKSYKPGRFSEIIAAAGGRENAFTGADYTCYFQQLEKSQLPLSIKMEADRMQNLVITEEEFKKEIKVVME